MGILKNLEMRWKYRGQVEIQRDEGTVRDASKAEVYFQRSYDALEVVRRGVDLIVDAASEIDVDIQRTIPTNPVHDGGRKRLNTLKK